MKRIIFGGSFDPIHNGHKLMAETARKVVGADVVEFVLAPRSRWKEGALDSTNRLAMLSLYLKDINWAKICLYEVETNAERNYTIETIKHFKKTVPSDELYLLIGADQVNKFHRWKEASQISQLVQILCYRRPGYILDDKNLETFNIRVIDGQESIISSSAIRGLFSIDTSDAVIDYICDHNIYFMHKIANYISGERIAHSIQVARLARQIAYTNELDATGAFMAGLLHDIAKEVPLDNMEYIMGQWYPEYVKYPKWTHHQFVGEYIASSFFNVVEAEVLKAIRVHATGNAHMSPLSMVLYAADKIEPTRGYDSSILINQCLLDYKKGFKTVVVENRKFLGQVETVADNPLTQACYKMYGAE